MFRLVAAVGDGSAPVWLVASWMLEARLAHPSYVYTARFHPQSSRLLATAGYDRVVRLWGRGEATEAGYQVLQELAGHSHHINCLVFDMEGHFLFTGDARGGIRMWESPEPPSSGPQSAAFDSSTDSFAPPKAGRGRWGLKREYRLEDGGQADARSVRGVAT